MPTFNRKPIGIFQLNFCEGDGGAAGGDGGAGGASGGDDKNKPTTFTQDQVNSFLAAEKKKWQTQQQKSIDELKELKNSLTTTVEEKESLAQKIAEMETQLLSKEELAEREKKRIQQESEGKIQTLSAERDGFRNLYAGYRIENEITTEAVKQKAFNPKQIVALLRSDTRLTPVVGEDKKPTGEFAASVAVKSVKDGKPVTLELSIADAVKRMKETPEEFGNLFEAALQDGVGGRNVGSGGAGGLNPGDLKDPATYRKNREKLGIKT